MTAWRLLRDGPAAGAWNMAVDEALLDGAARPDAAPTLRWYRWREPTASLGYFQPWGDCPAELAALPRVRRLSGGGAILHDDEWTYSLALPPGQWPRKSHVELVADVHAAAAAALAELFPALPPCETAAGRKEIPHGEPFLCFARRSAGDLLCGGHKLLGSAAHGRKGTLLQHGSLVRRRSSFAPAQVGVLDLLPNGADAAAADALPERIAARLATAWGVGFVAAELAADERADAERLAAERYASAAWNERR